MIMQRVASIGIKLKSIVPRYGLGCGYWRADVPKRAIHGLIRAISFPIDPKYAIFPAGRDGLMLDKLLLSEGAVARRGRGGEGLMRIYSKNQISA